MRILRDLVLVHELHDAETVYAPGGKIAFYWPETEHSESNVGIVQEIGPDVDYSYPGDTVIFHPYAGYAVLSDGLRILPERDILGKLQDQRLFPAPHMVMVDPDWSDTEKRGLIILPKEHIPHNPRTRGTCIAVGWDVQFLMPGDKVVIPPGLAGFEVGLRNKVYYLIPEEEILATIEETEPCR